MLDCFMWADLSFMISLTVFPLNLSDESWSWNDFACTMTQYQFLLGVSEEDIAVHTSWSLFGPEVRGRMLTSLLLCSFSLLHQTCALVHGNLQLDPGPGAARLINPSFLSEVGECITAECNPSHLSGEQSKKKKVLMWSGSLGTAMEKARSTPFYLQLRIWPDRSKEYVNFKIKSVLI